MTAVLHVLEALEGGTARHVVDLVRWARGTEHHVAVPAAAVGRGHRRPSPPSRSGPPAGPSTSSGCAACRRTPSTRSRSPG